MKALVLVCMLTVSFSTFSKEKSKSLKFLKSESLKNKKKYRYNQYESVFSGGAAFVLGNIGYYTTESISLKMAYSGIQTIGIFNIGQGIYDYHRPVFDKELYNVAKKTNHSEQTASGIIKIFAKEERAKRLSLLWKSSLLATQYFSNAYLDNTQDDLKEIYKFLGGVNLIVVGYTLFFKNKYEEFVYTSFSPVLLKDRDNHSYAGLLYQHSF